MPFTFKIESVTPADGTKIGTITVDAGPAGGVTVDNGSVKFDNGVGETTMTNTTAKLKIDKSKFTESGIYRYVVTENNGGWKGVTYSTDKFYVDVYVTYNNSNELVVSSVATYKNVQATSASNQNTGKEEINFINTTRHNPDIPDTPDDPDPGKGEELNDYTLTKIVTGNQGNKNQKFTFNVTIVPANTGAIYNVDVNGKTQTVGPDNYKFDADLKDGEKITIYGLANDDKVQAVETAVKDYVTKWGDKTNETTSAVNVAVGDCTTEALDTGAIAMSAKDHNIGFNNDKTVTTPTGLIMSYGPYALMVLAAIAVAVVFFRKKREDY